MQKHSCSVIINTHFLFPGIAHDASKYLRDRGHQVTLISHDFSSRKTRQTHLERFLGKKSTFCLNSRDYRFLPDMTVYIKDFIYSLYYSLKYVRQADIFIGLGAFNTIPALLLKPFLKTKVIVFYTIDYVPNRFSNIALNRLYHWLDKICLKYSSETWNLSPRMSQGRFEYQHLDPRDYPLQKIVPVGVWLEEIKPFFKRRHLPNYHELIFTGHLLEKQGVQTIIQAVPLICRNIHDFKFTIIGTGDYEAELKKLVIDLNLSKRVIFTGPIYERRQLSVLLASAGLAAAMYDKRYDTFTYYADPTKIKTYLSHGLPILVSDVPYNAAEIVKRGCGKIIDNNVSSIARATINLMKNTSKIKLMRQKAFAYAESFDWNRIYDSAFLSIWYKLGLTG